MYTTSPIAIPNPYPSRRGWLMAFGIFEILIGCGFLLLILFSAFAFLGPARAKIHPSPISPVAMLAMVGTQYGLVAAAFFAGGIGSILCKNWARILMLVVSGLWLFMGLIGTLTMAFIVPTVMHTQSAHVPSGMEHGILVGIIAFSITLGVLLPAVFLLFYTRKSVRATCLAPPGNQLAAPAVSASPATPAMSASPQTAFPVPLAILGAWEALQAFSVLAILFIMPMTVLFGVILRGAAAVLVLLAISVLSGIAAWMIFQQKFMGWQIAIFKAGFMAVSALVTYVRAPDMLQMFRKMNINSQGLRIYEQFPKLLPLIWVGTLVMIAVLIAFILYTRQFFLTEKRV